MSDIKTIEGDFNAGQARFGIAVARFNSFISESLLDAAIDTLKRHGVKEAAIEVVRVPGAFELPLAVQAMAKGGQYDAILAVGCIIRGGTPHFDYVAGESAKGISSVAMQHEMPVIFGVLTTDTIEQAIERAGTKAGNKGADAAMAAIEMVSLLRKLGG